mgnify:CR=1 FL=1
MVRWFSLSLLLLGSCTVYELESEGRIYRPRILAMQIEPPEARIGDRVRITPLIATPADFSGVIDTTWLTCLGRQGDGDGESRDWCRERSLERVVSTANELIYEVPDSLPKQQVEQLSFTGGYWKRLTVEIKDRFGGDQDRAFKRLVVKPAANPLDPTAEQRFAMTRNRNPQLPEVEVFVIASDDTLSPVPSDANLLANTDYLFRFVINKTQRQDYQSLRIDFSGLDPSAASQLTPEEIEQRVTVEERRERMVMRYYRTDGRFGRDQKPVRTFDSTAEDPAYYPAEISWALNTESRVDPLPERVRLWFVVTDGRGGMDWVSFERSFELGEAKPRAAESSIKSPPDLGDDNCGRPGQ